MPDAPALARPRVRHVPDAVDNDAGDAAFLASSYGLTPDPWQADVLEGWMGRQPEGRWAASYCGLAVPRQNGKNGLLEIRELFGMVSLGEKFLHTAHEVKTARKAFLRIASFFENTRRYPELAALVKDIRKTNGQEAVLLTNGGSVEFIARSKGSGRGFTVDVLVLDEAQDLTDDELAALLPTISASPLGNPQVYLTGTPPDPDKRGKGEVFARIRHEGETAADATMAWVDYGPPDGAMPDVEDRSLWPQHNPAQGLRIHEAEIERELALMSPEAFARERMGWWGDPAAMAGEEIFGRGNWDACATELPAPQVTALGIAASLDQSWGSLGAAGERAGVTHIGSVQRRPGTAWMVAEAARIQAEHDCLVAIDERGPAADLIPLLEAANVVVQRAGTGDYLDACAALFRDVQEHTVTHGHTAELDLAVAGAAWRQVGDRRAWGRKSSSTDVAMLEAATLAKWATESTSRGFNIW